MEKSEVVDRTVDESVFRNKLLSFILPWEVKFSIKESLATNEITVKPCIIKRACYYYPNVFASYLTIGYYFGIFPCKFVFNHESQTFQLHSTTFQKVIFRINMTGMSIYMLLRMARQFTFLILTDATILFGVATRMSIGFKCFSYCFICWTKIKSFEKIGNLVKDSESLIPSNILNWIVAPIALFVTNLLCGTWDCLDYNMTHVTGSKFNSSVQYSLWLTFQKGVEYLDYGNNLPWNTYVLDWVVLYFRWFSCLTSQFVQNLCLLCAFAVYEISLGLERKIHKDHTIMDLMENYELTRKRLSILNSTFRGIILTWFVAVVAVINFAVHIVFNYEQAVLKRIIFLFFVIQLGITIFFSCEAHKKMMECKKVIFKKLWVNEVHGEVQEPCQSAANYLEVISSEMGLMGGDFFTITYAFSGMSLSLMVTYFLVLVQFFLPPPSK